MSFDLLSEPIRKYIREKGWEQLRPIQTAAIAKILSSNNNYILASRTASGKTEAAFLPILSKLNFSESGVQVLYISPLIALINDQFFRVEELCQNLDVKVTKWHGEANKTLKDKLIKSPSGIVLITPESLEAMFVNKPYNIKQLFSNLKYTVVDEIHSFIGTDRGIQLKSLLSRLQNVNSQPFITVGLSATIGDYEEAKKFTGDEIKTTVLLDRTAKEIKAIFRFFKSTNTELPLDLIKDLYNETKNNKVLIFPNSRGRAEEVAVKLKKISDRVKGHSNYFSHHSSVDREVREYVEYFAKNNDRENFCISCTSTLELGIDIGTVDEVVQIDATHSISSLIQRVGRSGRKDGAISKLFLYATGKWSLLQSLACWLLYKEGFIEPSQKSENPYDILVHQALSIVKGHSGIVLTELITQIKRNSAFCKIETHEIDEILNHLIKIDFLEKIRDEVIIGVEGERIVNSRDFYSVFKLEDNYKVINRGNSIGDVPFSPQIVEDENILLAAKIWKIKFVDHRTKKIDVVPANDGKNPKFFGSGIAIHKKIREKMFEILCSKDKYDFLDISSVNELQNLREEFSVFIVKELEIDKPLLKTEKHLQLFTFTGTRINRTIHLLLNVIGINSTLDENSSSFEMCTSENEFIQKFELILHELLKIHSHIGNTLQSNPGLLDFSKWGVYLPVDYQVRLIKEKFFDIENTKEYLSKVKFVNNQL